MTAKLSAEELERLEALAKAATPGPWTWTPQEFEQNPDGTLYAICGANVDGPFVFETGDGYMACDDANAAFIAAARTAVPSLLAQVREAEALETEVRAVLASLPQRFVVRVREGNGPENVAASLAVSVANLVDRLEREPPPARETEFIDNGNLFVFCEHHDSQRGGCIRGAGHNGHHIFAQPHISILAPVVLAAPPPAQREGRE